MNILRDELEDETSPKQTVFQCETGFSIESQQDIGKVVVKIIGEVDMNSSTFVENYTKTYINRFPHNDIHLDLSGVSFIDSVGLASILCMRDLLRRYGHKLLVEHVSPPVKRLVTLLSVQGTSELFETQLKVV